MLNLIWLQSLLAVVRHRGFQAAGQALNLSQPAVSQHIQRLEEELGVALIIRGRRECVPTAAARDLLPYAESLLRLEQQARAAVLRNTLRVGASSNIGIYLLQPVLRSFEASTDGQRYELVIEQNPAIAEKLRRGELDIALMEWSEPGSGLQSAPWRREPLVLIVPPEHELANETAISREQLSRLALLGGEPGTGTGRLLSQYFAGEPMPTVSRQLGSTEAVKQAVKAGLGVSLVMASAVEEEVRAGTLCAVPVAGTGLLKELYVTWRSSQEPSSVPLFVDHLLQTA
ncbi:LysR family transcriptional regulator [Halopseudomonas sp.]|uniref:LysR family transcriptional regulator n=1 Tax=Halopseudomonas sp. TaxID=2901191 RepID=UPI001A5ED388|nr:LysR family transcriptional regulator [Pseudomonas sp.]|tara:strand:- start:515 stop:1375 length:861 start_codon:yes stop_codon:yes gene_type:complete